MKPKTLFDKIWDESWVYVRTVVDVKKQPALVLDKNFTTQYIKIRLKHQRMLDSHNFTEDINAWEEEFFEALEFMRELKIINGEYFINDRLGKGAKVLAEGAQGSMLDVDFGTFPFVTSSSTTSAGVCSGGCPQASAI